MKVQQSEGNEVKRFSRQPNGKGRDCHDRESLPLLCRLLNLDSSGTSLSPSPFVAGGGGGEMSSDGEGRTDNESESSTSPPSSASSTAKASSFPAGSYFNPYKLAIVGGGPAGSNSIKRAAIIFHTCTN